MFLRLKLFAYIHMNPYEFLKSSFTMWGKSHFIFDNAKYSLFLYYFITTGKLYFP